MADETTTRVLRLIDFLAAFEAQKNPPVRTVAAHNLYMLRDSEFPQGPGVALNPPGSEAWLTIDFVSLPPQPAMPKNIGAVLDPTAELVAEKRPVVTVSENPGRRETKAAERAEEWITARWEPWSASYRAARAVKNLYRDLFEQRELLSTDRETYELVWGFGRARCQLGNGTAIDHPLMTVPVEVAIDPSSGQLRVEPAGEVQVESFFLAGVDIADRTTFNAVRMELADDDTELDLWDTGTRRGLLQRLIRAIDHDGGFLGQVAFESGTATVDDSWVLHLRRRRPDYQGFLDDLRTLYRSGAVPPDPLKAIVIDAPSSLITDPDPNPEPLLLPLPSNEEQRRILELARIRPGVTVQGPPGTGKSHTIANLISHYVAYGKRVLVVAEKEQALSVLADKIPAGIRDLTVSVLGADDEGRRQLEASISQIQARVANLDRDHTDEKIELLEQELAATDAEIVGLTDRMLAVRTSEITPLGGGWEAGTNPTPAQVATWLADNAATLGFVTDPITTDQPLPFPASDFADYLTLLSEVGPDRAAAANAHTLPNPTDLPTGATLHDHFAVLAALAARQAKVRSGSVSWEAVDDAPDQLVKDLAVAVDKELEWHKATADGWAAQLNIELADDLLYQQWRDFTEDCSRDREHLLGLTQVVEAHQVDVPAEPSPELATQLREAGQRLFTKGRLGFGPRALQLRRALEQCGVDGKPPTSPTEIDICRAQLEINARRRVLHTRWNKRLQRIEGPQVSPELPEIDCGDALDHLTLALVAGQRWYEIQGQLDRLGASTSEEPSIEELTRLRHLLEAAAFRQERRQVEEDRAELFRRLDSGRSQPDASPLWAELADAVLAQDVAAWDQARDEVVSLARVTEQATRFTELHEAIAEAAPRWTEVLVASTNPRRGRRKEVKGGKTPTPAPLPNPADFERAWQWRQLETWLAGVSEEDEPGDLQRQLEAKTEQRQRTVSDLVAHRAWRRLADHIGDAERQALNSYLQAMKRYGRTGGKYAARWMAQIRSALNESKEAIPVWIMPTGRALSGFRPETTPPFDVLVIDEASQLGQEALPLLALARSTIVVGDDKQTSPENVGLQREPVFGLLEEHLSPIPRYRTLFDPDASLYDLAFQKFPDVIMLTEHFRSLPPIIDFSSTHAYDRQIVSLRDRLPVPDWAPVKAIKVDGAHRSGDLNEAEAEAVVELLAKLCADPRYDKMTFGVISLLGASQSKLIWRRLFDELGPEVMRDRHIRCGEPAAFQGDERDVIVISMVVAAAPGARVGAMTNRAAERRVNVAASRARNQLWLVHSVDANQFAPGDLRADLILHCQNPPRSAAAANGSGNAEGEGDLADRCESDLERAVLEAIQNKGYDRLYVQHPVGRYQIDIVVEGPDDRLAIECETDRWLGEEAWRRDRARQQVLERAGWTFEPVRASSYFRNPATALKPVWARLDDLGISPSPSSARARSARSRTRSGAKAEPEPVSGAAGPELAPYQEWAPYKVSDVTTATIAELIDQVLDIVEVEGPVHADRVIKLHTAAAGSRLTAATKMALGEAIDAATSERQLVRFDDAMDDPGQATLRLPRQSDVVLRELGPRRLTDVPRSEIRYLVDQLGLLDQPDQAKQAVRATFGFPRLTDKFKTYIDECLR